jgi:hypothetical protein
MEVSWSLPRTPSGFDKIDETKFLKSGRLPLYKQNSWTSKATLHPRANISLGTMVAHTSEQKEAELVKNGGEKS